MYIFCSPKLLFSIYILFNIAQAPSGEIHVRYNNQIITFRRNTLEEYSITNVEDLIEELKPKLRKIIKNAPDKVITLRRGEEVLNSETPITELYNTEDQALHVVVGKHNIRLYLL